MIQIAFYIYVVNVIKFILVKQKLKKKKKQKKNVPMNTKKVQKIGDTLNSSFSQMQNTNNPLPK